MSAPASGQKAERKGAGGWSDQEVGHVMLGIAGAAVLLALWPAAAIGAVAVVGARGFRVRPAWIAAPLAGAAAIPLAVGLELALERYGAAGPAWNTAAALGELGVLGWLATVAPIALPAGLALALIALAVDAARSSPEQKLARREASGRRARRREASRARARAGAPVREAEPGAVDLGLALGEPDEQIQTARRGPAGRRAVWVQMSLDDVIHHTIVFGASGEGKTITLLRIVDQVARLAPDWRIFYVDAKARSTAAELFPQMMNRTARDCEVFPGRALAGWRGTPQEIAERLLQATPLGTEEGAAYYALTVEQLVHLVCGAPAGPPQTSAELLRRLNRGVLEALYTDDPGLDAVARLKNDEIDGAYRRFDAFFRGAAGGLDGDWSWDDSDSGYILVDSTRFGRSGPQFVNYLLEDFVQYVTGRKTDDRPILIVVDEFAAGAAQSPAAIEIVERLRQLGGHAILAPQVVEGMGDPETRARFKAVRTTICHRVPNPEEIAELAGTKQGIESSIQFHDDRATGLGSAREQYQWALNPQEIRELEPGQAFVIRRGHKAKLQVAWPGATVGGRNGDEPGPLYERERPRLGGPGGQPAVGASAPGGESTDGSAPTSPPVDEPVVSSHPADGAAAKRTDLSQVLGPPDQGTRPKPS